jgi:hypothetical protein
VVGAASAAWHLEPPKLDRNLLIQLSVCAAPIPLFFYSGHPNLGGYASGRWLSYACSSD